MTSSPSRLYFAEPSAAARRLLWHALSLGSVTRDEPERHSGYDKPGVFLFWVVAGLGTMEVEGHDYPLQRGNCCWLVDLRQPRNYLPQADSMLHTEGVRFSGPGVEAWLELLRGPPDFQFTNAKEMSLLRRSLRRLLVLVQNQPAGYEWDVHLILTNILGVLLANRQILSASSTEIVPPVARVLEAVLANPVRDWKARELAAVAHLSYSRLRELFRRSQQQTLHEFLQRTRLDQARRLLGDRTLSIKEVAAQLNFSSEFYFSHFFRHATGISPTQFREDCRT